MHRSIIIFSLLALLTSALSAQFNFGAGATILTKETNFGVAAKASYTINESFSGKLTATYFLRSGSGLAFDIDGHLDILTIGSVDISPLVGFNIRKAGSYGVAMNVGAFVVVPTENYKLFIEPKFIFDNVTLFAISAGFYF